MPAPRPLPPGHEWREPDRVARYRAEAPLLSCWAESEAAFVAHLPARVGRLLDIGTGDGRLADLVRGARPGATAVGVDLSEPMLAAARERFAGSRDVALVVHDLAEPLPPLGAFDLVVSGLAIHHLEDVRKRALYREVLGLLSPGGCLLNLEHVASGSEALHLAFLAAIGERPGDEDPSDRLVSAGTQLGWLTELGFADVDCFPRHAHGTSPAGMIGAGGSSP